MSKRVLHSLARFFSLIVVIFCASFVSTPVIWAQLDNSIGIQPGETFTQPKERAVTVTAKVQDNTPPSIPILISPPNDSKLSDNTPTFIWKGSTDAFGIDHYILTIDGSTLFSTIPITESDNAEYTLTYDATQHYYSLTPKKGITDGEHTWKITAVDSYDNTASSVTWKFTIDTQSPVFVITEIDGAEHSISAQDVSTIPTEPIVLTNNEPILKGTGEAKSTVELFVRLPDSSSTTYTFTIADGGSWEVQLGTLPRDAVVYLDFRITDIVGHISILEDVPLLLKTKKIVLPPIPILPPPEEPIEIPVPPIEEVIPEIIETIPPELIPAPVAQMMALFPVLNATPRPVGYFSLSSILVLLLISILPILKTIILATRFGADFALSSLWEIWRVIGLIPGRKPQGIAVYHDTQVPVPFAKVVLTGKLNDYHHITRTRLTDKEGIYSPSDLENGSYQVNVLHPQTLFPTLAKKPAHLAWSHYYQGQEFIVNKDHHEPHLVIPVDQAEVRPTLLRKLSWWVTTRSMANLPMLASALVICLVASSGANLVATLLYAGCWAWLRWPIWKKQVAGHTITIEKVPLINLIIWSFNYEANRLLSISQSSEQGIFKASWQDRQARLWGIDFSYKLANPTTGTSAVTNTFVVKQTESRPPHPILVFKKVA